MRRKRVTRTSIEVTDACNLFCSACRSPHGNNFMSVETFTTLAKKLRGRIASLALHWRGEPCLHPQLPELARIACAFELKPWLSTNMAVPNLGNPDYVKRLLDSLNWIEICVDGYDKDSASQYRVGANWKTMLHNLRTISKIDTPCTKKMRVLMFKYNDGKEDTYRKMAKQYGMNELIFARPLITLEKTISQQMAEKWLSTNRKYQRYIKRREVWHRVTGHCNTNPVISVYGTVHPCGLDWKLEHSLGNLIDEDWEVIMNKYKNIVPTMGSQKMCEFCCAPGQRVNFMEKIK